MTISSLRLALLLLGCVGAVPACATSTRAVTSDAGLDAESPSEGGPLPDAGAPPDAEANASGGGARVFVTATKYAAKSLGGGASRVAGADGFCANAAAAAGLGGSWVAWLSTSTVNAIDRVTGTGPWYLVDGTTLLFSNKAALATVPRAGIGMNELGVRSETITRVWTGTANGGAVSLFTCDDWTNGTNRGKGMVGIGGQAAEWTQFLEESCDHQESLYCFEVK